MSVVERFHAASELVEQLEETLQRVRVMHAALVLAPRLAGTPREPEPSALAAAVVHVRQANAHDSAFAPVDAELVAALAHTEAVLAADAHCRASLRSSAADPELPRWLRSAEAQDAVAAIATPSLAATKAHLRALEDQCADLELTAEEGSLFDLAQLRTPVRETVPLLLTDYAAQAGFSDTMADMAAMLGTMATGDLSFDASDLIESATPIKPSPDQAILDAFDETQLLAAAPAGLGSEDLRTQTPVKKKAASGSKKKKGKKKRPATSPKAASSPPVATASPPGVEGPVAVPVSPRTEDITAGARNAASPRAKDHGQAARKAASPRTTEEETAAARSAASPRALDSPVSASVTLAWLDAQEAQRTARTRATPRNALRVTIKKLFSVTTEAKAVKESSAVRREKKKMEKLMRSQGVEVSGNAEQADLIKASKSGPASPALSVKVKDSDPLLFVRVRLGDVCRRQSSFHLSSSEEASEPESVVLPFDGEGSSVQLLLCGNSGMFGPTGSSVLGMQMFDTPAALAALPAPVLLRHGRHSFEVHGSVEPYVMETPRIVAAPAVAFDELMKARRTTLQPVVSLLRDGLTNPPAAAPPSVNVKKDVIRMACMEPSLSLARMGQICDQVVRESYRLEAGAQRAWRNEAGFSLLHMAALAGHHAALAYLCRNKLFLFEAEAPTACGANAFHLAVVAGSAPCLVLLLNGAENVERACAAPWVNRMPLLHLAAALGRADCVDEILRRSTTALGHTDLTGNTALMWACYAGSADIVAALLVQGDSPVADDEERNTPLHIAAGRGWTDVVALLLKQPACHRYLSKPNVLGSSALWHALQSGSPEVVRLVVAAGDAVVEINADEDASWNALAQVWSGLDVNLRHDSHQNTPLHRACLSLDDERLPGLIQALASSRKLNVNDQNTHGHTAAHIAAALGKWRALDALRAAGSGADQLTDKYGNTLLHFALCGPSVDWLLTACKLELDARNGAGWTPLHMACSCGTSEAVSALLAYDCDPTVLSTASLLPFESPCMRLVLPYEDSEEFPERLGGLEVAESGTLRHSLGSVGKLAAPSKERRQSLTQGLSKRSSLVIKKKDVSIFFQLAGKRF